MPSKTNPLIHIPMNPEVQKFLEFKANTLKRASAGEITVNMANTIIQPALTEFIRASYLSKDLFIKEVLTSEYPDHSIDKMHGNFDWDHYDRYAD